MQLRNPQRGFLDLGTEYTLANHLFPFQCKLFGDVYVKSAYQKHWFPLAWTPPQPIDPASKKPCIILNSVCPTMPLAKLAYLDVGIPPTGNPFISRSKSK